MSKFQTGQSTGPKSQSGKAISSQNARKDSIFVQGYLPWENPEEKRQEFNAMVKQWRAKDPTRLMLIQTIQQSSISMERMMYAQTKKIEGLMQSNAIANQFCQRAGISLLIADNLPAWFFLEGTNEKQKAQQLLHIYKQAENLKAAYSDRLVAQVEDRYPLLFAYVMENQKQGASFLMTLGQQYQQPAPTLNLAKLMNTLQEKFPHYFL
jgi:hypothetical protein